MKLIRSLSAVTDAARQCVVAIGNFDGLHLGHRAVLAQAQGHARRLNAPLAIMSFEPHPRRLFNPDLPPLRLVPLHQKCRLLRDAGVDSLFLLPFDMAFSQLSAEGFMQSVLVDALQARHVVTGADFRFGYQRQGEAALLAAQHPQFGYSPVPAFTLRGMPCSSTRIREALSLGDLALARSLLGRDYTVRSRVMQGEQRGRKLGFPTANLHPGAIFSPRYGVYAVELTDEAGRTYPAVANFGVRPTYPLTTPLWEVHCLKAPASLDLYGQAVSITLKAYLREEQRFDGVQAMKDQLAQDVSQAQALLLEGRDHG